MTTDFVIEKRSERLYATRLQRSLQGRPHRALWLTMERLGEGGARAWAQFARVQREMRGQVKGQRALAMEQLVQATEAAPLADADTWIAAATYAVAPQSIPRRCASLTAADLAADTEANGYAASVVMVEAAVASRDSALSVHVGLCATVDGERRDAVAGLAGTLHRFAVAVLHARYAAFVGTPATAQLVCDATSNECVAYAGTVEMRALHAVNPSVFTGCAARLVTAHAPSLVSVTSARVTIDDPTDSTKYVVTSDAAAWLLRPYLVATPDAMVVVFASKRST